MKPPPPPPPTRQATLRDYLGFIGRRKWMVVVAVVVTTLVALVASTLQTPIYEATAQVLVQSPGADGLFEEESDDVNQRAIDTEIEVIEGAAVRNRVAGMLSADEVLEAEAAAVSDTDTIEVSVRGTDAVDVTDTANAYAEAYIDVRREQSVEQLLAASEQVDEAIGRLQDEIDALDVDDPRRDALLAQQATFELAVDQLRVDAALRTGGAAVIEAAEVPIDPVEPKPLLAALLGAFAGLLLGVGAALFVDRLDETVRTATDVTAMTTRPVLAEVPIDPPSGQRPIALTDPLAPSVEQYRRLRTNLQFSAVDRPLKIVQVTSAREGEGKTTTAANLAVVMARAGHRVALLDGDLRRPNIDRVFAITTSRGLGDLLLGAGLADVRSHVTLGDGTGLDVICSGPLPPDPGETLSGRRMHDVLADLREHYDFVVVDSAPVLPVAEPVALAGAVDGVLVVAQAGRVDQRELDEALERMRQVDAPVLGIVLNRVRRHRGDYYGAYTSKPSASASARAEVVAGQPNG